MAALVGTIFRVGRAGAEPEAPPAGEGALSVVAWHGLLESDWVKPFEQQTGCKVEKTYVASSNQLVALMREGKYDVGAASGDVARWLVGYRAVRPLDLGRVPATKTFLAPFRAPEATTVGGKQYGVAIHWAPDTLLYQSKHTKRPPTSWSAIYNPAYRGKITVPNNPMQIADAALYLSKASPDLRIVDPYELTPKQLAAALDLLRRQRPLLAGYWDYPSDEVQLFQNGRAVVGAGWPWQAATLRASKVPVLEADPREGMTGWTDSWMIAAHAAHPNCAYRWLQYTSTPTVQARIARSYGAAPVSAAACNLMEHQWPGSCRALHGDATPAYFRSIHFWKTPLDICANGTKHCTDYTDWQRAWTQIAG